MEAILGKATAFIFFFFAYFSSFPRKHSKQWNYSIIELPCAGKTTAFPTITNGRKKGGTAVLLNAGK